MLELPNTVAAGATMSNPSMLTAVVAPAIEIAGTSIGPFKEVLSLPSSNVAQSSPPMMVTELVIETASASGVLEAHA
ncbi:MAG: hypothetical protein U0271_20320 [Polyangiaceae bacterium]